MEGNKKFEWTEPLVKSAITLLAKKFAYPNEASDDWEGIEKEIEKFKASHSIDVGRDEGEITFVKHKVTGSILSFYPSMTDSFDIYSVIRKSDMVTFSVGDRIVSKMNPSAPFTIIKIQVINDTAIYLDNCPLDRALKLPPERSKILTDKNGIDIFEGDSFFVVSGSNYAISGEQIASESDRGYWEQANIFSTRDKAVEYVKRKKEIFSVDDILKLCEEIQFHNRIHDRADEDYYAVYVSLLEKRLLEISKSKIKL